ncbi:MAG: HupE/UreJ family protein [Pseudomonadota bacterium]
MSVFNRSCAEPLRVALLAVLSSIVALFCFAGGTAHAHEVQPAVADLVIGDEFVEIEIRLNLEAPLAGINLAGLADTNDAANSDAYDALRNKDSGALEDDLWAAWPRLADQIMLRAGETRLIPELLGVSIPDVGNAELPRFSTLSIGANLPPGDDPVAFGWEASLGSMILRQQGVEDGYTAFLQNGSLSDPIARTGGDIRTAGAVFADYVISGFEHIIPKGLDHILFVLGLFFFALKWSPILWQVTAFTVAHTVTLGLATVGIISIPTDWMWLVEALIAASITYVAVENVLRPTMGWLRPAVVFGFGLLHGLGFASVLGEFGLPQGQFLTALLAFNVGVELGQLAVVLGAILLLLAGRAAAEAATLEDDEAMARDLPVIYRSVSLVGSLVIAAIGLFWTLERVGLFG